MDWIRVVVSIAAILTVGGVVAVLKFWNNLADWMIRSILPWFKSNLPDLEPLVRDIFNKISDLIVPIIQKLRQDWGKLKRHFVGQLIYFERKTPNFYIQKVCSYFRKELEINETYEEHIVTTEINPIDIPPEFRREIIGHTHSKVNTTEHVDETIENLDKKSDDDRDIFQ